MKILHLTLKKQWFDMILSGEKKEEYREVKPYWFERLVFRPDKIKVFFGITQKSRINQYCVERILFDTLKKSMIAFNPYDAIKLTNGYSKNAPSITIECKGIEIREGKPEWGATPGEMYFVLKLGEILTQ